MTWKMRYYGHIWCRTGGYNLEKDIIVGCMNVSKAGHK